MMSQMREKIFSIRQRRRRGGFSFIEVLFAVILLGIGFIMIAGIFPVAIEQTTTTANETAGQLVCRDAIRMIQNAASMYGGSALFPSTSGTVNPLPYTPGAANLYQALAINPYPTSDHRYGWVAFYSRSSLSSPFAQVFVIALENPNFATYMVSGQTSPAIVTTGTVPPPIPPSLYDGAPPAPSASAPFSAATITATITSSDIVTLGGSGLRNPSNAVTGAYMLVSYDPGIASGTPARPAGTLNGRIFRLGIDQPGDSNGTMFQLEPGMDLNNSNNDGYETASTGPLLVFIIGRAPTLNGTPSSNPPNYLYTGPFTGPNQDIAAMSAMISVNTAAN